MMEAAAEIPVETHPLEPFLPEDARLLMLGSFPPKRERWSMDFFYPNFNNDMWRIFGLVFFSDRAAFIAPDGKHFDKDAITGFCRERKIALSDTALKVRRLKDNASDKFLEVGSPMDIGWIAGRLPECKAIVTTGLKAAEIAAEALHCSLPAPGCFSEGSFIRGQEKKRLWRMPSSSRAYPLSLEKKAQCYRSMFMHEGLI